MNSDYGQVDTHLVRTRRRLSTDGRGVQLVRVLPKVALTGGELAMFLGNASVQTRVKPAEEVDEPQVCGVILSPGKAKKPVHLHSQSSIRAIYPREPSPRPSICPSLRSKRVHYSASSLPLKKPLQETDQFQVMMKRHLYLTGKCSLKLLSRVGRAKSPLVPWWDTVSVEVRRPLRTGRGVSAHWRSYSSLSHLSFLPAKSTLS